MEHHFEVSWSISCVRSSYSMVRSLVGIFLPLFCVVDLETSNGLMPAAGELMMLNRLLIVPGIEHTMRNIWVNFWLLVLRPRGSLVLQVSCMSAPGIRWSTPPVHKVVGDTERLDRWCETYYSCSQWARRWLLLRKPHSWALILRASSVMSSLSLRCLVILNPNAIFWPSELLFSCVCLSILIRMEALIFWVCFLNSK